jgi:LPS sulfotransferase NodH
MPELPQSFTIWFSQRTGSTWLCQALSSTNIAGRPREWFHAADPADLLAHYGVANVQEMIAKMRLEGATPNGVFGLKQGISYPYFSRLLALLGQGTPSQSASRIDLWETLFPDHKHIFMTRRNKVRLAVSWWRAIRSGEWHRRQDESKSDIDVSGDYNFSAIDHLVSESILREAALQELFDEAGIIPLTVTYEDMLKDPQATVHNVLGYLRCEDCAIPPLATDLQRLADDLSEEWVQRYRGEKQANWQSGGW